MDRYLAEIFGLNVKIENWEGKSKLPLYLRNKRAYYVLSIGNMQSIAMKNDSDNFQVSIFKKEMQQIEEIAGMPVILWLESISTYQRNALVKNRISFIVPNSQVYVPQMGVYFRELCARKKEPVEKLPAVTQFLLLYFIYQKQMKEISQSEIAKLLNMSAMNVSRAVRELQELNLLKVRKDKTQKRIKAVAVGKELYQLSSKYLQNPVQKKIYLSISDYDMDLPLAGETALAKQSMLNLPKCTVFAMDKRIAKDIPQETLIEPKLVADSDYVEIELWKYNPSVYADNGMVDIVSLALSLREIEDERVEMQINKLLEDYGW